MTAYYNEIDPYAAAWLRNLIAAGHIAAGEVDERSIVDVRPDDLRGFGQCHFFAGIGGWSYALRLAGIPDDRPIWSGSCPCQPFSVAGAKRGCEDERHLWPAFFNLIRECRPATVFGEQVAGAAGYAWWDHVAADLEGEGYAAAAADLGAHSVGAPHIRQRLYWVAHAEYTERGAQHVDREYGRDGSDGGWEKAHGVARACGEVCRMAHSNETGRIEQRIDQLFDGERTAQRDDADGCGSDGGVGNAASFRFDRLQERGLEGAEGERRLLESTRASHWSDLEWIACSDGKYRPVGAGIFPLAARLPKGLVRGGDRSMAPDANESAEARVMRLRGYGNGIVPQLAAAFVRAAFGYTE